MEPPTEFDRILEERIRDERQILLWQVRKLVLLTLDGDKEHISMLLNALNSLDDAA